MADLTDDDFAETGGSVASRPRVVQGQRGGPFQFLREIRDELRQVAWPTRGEMVNYSLVVFFTLVVMVLLIFFMNFVFGKGIYFMFQK
ncbi:MAG: preprotein translocase subunit SecE [Acidimicrobiales bacterium]